MKALLVSEYGALNGGEYSFLTALPWLQAAGFQFAAALPGDSGFAECLRKRSVEVIPVSFLESDGTRKSQGVIRSELHRVIEHVRPVIVHANSLAASRILGPVTAKSGVVGLGYVRDIIKLSRKAIEDVNCLDVIVAVSSATANYHIANGLCAEKVKVIHNGVDLERFKPATPAAEDAPVNICLCIGQIGLRKGLDLSLQLLSSVFKHVDDAELWIVGERHSKKQESIDHENELRSFTDTRFASGKVKWLGRRNDIADLMQSARLLVHGARQEPLGRVLLEAAASGLPMVTTDVGGTPEILDGLEDLMFQPDRFTDATEKALELLTNPETHNDVSNRLRAIAETKFSSERAGRDLAELYFNAVGKRTT